MISGFFCFQLAVKFAVFLCIQYDIEKTLNRLKVTQTNMKLNNYPHFVTWSNNYTLTILQIAKKLP